MALGLRLLLILLFFSSDAFAFAIFSGDKKGSYYAVAQGICNVFNRYYSQKCEVRESKGSENNLRLLASDEADLAIVKNSQFNESFIKNSRELENKTDVVANIHDEYLTILVQKNLRVKLISDLENKIVNIGSSGSASALIVERYFSDFVINPKKIVKFGAAKSFEMMCDKKIDAWVYFIGLPNSGFDEVLKKCDVELVSLTNEELENFLKIAPFLEKKSGNIFSKTILASRKNFDSEIINQVKNILKNHREELIKENAIFKSFSHHPS